MAVKVAINGFGRIGRLAFRQMFGAEGSVSYTHLRAHETEACIQTDVWRRRI